MNFILGITSFGDNSNPQDNVFLYPKPQLFMMKFQLPQRILFLFCLLFLSITASTQTFIPLWEDGKMPNSRGLKLTDSIANERVYRVGTPGFYAFFPGTAENNGSAVVICPGGGYERLAYIISGFQLAKWFNTLGINAFVLNYRLPNSPDLQRREIAPIQDAQRALRLIRSKADEWKIDPKRVGIMGCSAGGHLASLAGSVSEDFSAVGDPLDKLAFRPNFMILISPVIDLKTYVHSGSRKNLLGENPDSSLIHRFSTQNLVDFATAPAFIVHAANDKSVSPMNSLLFYEALIRNKVPSSLHIFPEGGHSIALRNNPGVTDMWTKLCEQWLKDSGFIGSPPANK